MAHILIGIWACLMGFCFSITAQNINPQKSSFDKQLIDARHKTKYPTAFEQIQNLEKLIPHIRAQGYTDTLGIAYYYLSSRYWTVAGPNKAIEIGKDALHAFNTAQYTGYQKDKILQQIGVYFRELNQIDSSIFYLSQVDFDTKNENRVGAYSEAARDLCKSFKKIGEHEAALNTLMSFVQKPIFTKMHPVRSRNIQLELAKTHSLFLDQESKNQAEAVFHKLISSNTSPDGKILDLGFQQRILIDRGAYFARHGSYDLAIQDNLGLVHLIKHNDTNNITNLGKAYTNLAYAHHKLGNYLEMLRYAKKAYALLLQDASSFSLHDQYIFLDNLAIAYAENNRIDSAKTHLDQAFGVLEIESSLISVHDLADSPHKLELCNLIYDQLLIHAKHEEYDSQNSLISSKLLAYQLDSLMDYHIQDLLLDRSISNLKKSTQKYYHEGIDIAVKSDDPEMFWHFAEKTKHASLIKNQHYRQTDDPEISKLREAIRDKYKTKEALEFTALKNKEDFTNQIVSIKDEISKLRFELKQLISSFITPISSLAEIHSTCAGKSVIQYQFGKNLLYAMHAQKGQVEVVVLGEKNKIKRQIRELQTLLKTPGIESEQIRLSKSLYNTLLGKLQVLEEDIVIIPDEELNYLPFEILSSEKHESIGLSKNISYALSGSLYFQQQKHHKQIKLKSLFAPNYEDTSYILAQTRAGLGRLRYSQNEVQNIKNKVGGKIHTSTKSSFLDALYRADLIHYSGHAILFPDDSKYSFLAFNSQADSSNNHITSSEIARLQSHANLVVLSACETGIGDIQVGEGVMNMSRSFFQAGVASVVQTLWQVDDLSTSQIMTHFYRYLNKGLTKSEALKKAKLDFVANSADYQKDPYYWAGIILVGNDQPVEFKKALLIALTPWVLCICLLIFISIYSSKKP